MLFQKTVWFPECQTLRVSKTHIMANLELKEFQKSRVKEELKIKILRTIHKFKSKEEPHIMLSNDDVINVLSSIITRKTL